MIFFGTAHKLLELVRQRLRDQSPAKIKFLALDFRAVTGVDSSAAISFQRLQQLAHKQDFVLVFCQPSPNLRSQLTRGGFAVETDSHLQTFPDLNRAMEWCENRLLAQGRSASAHSPLTLRDQRSSYFADATSLSVRQAYLERQQIGQHHTLIYQDEPAEALYFVESGQVTVGVPRDEGGTLLQPLTATKFQTCHSERTTQILVGNFIGCDWLTLAATGEIYCLVL